MALREEWEVRRKNERGGRRMVDDSKSLRRYASRTYHIVLNEYTLLFSSLTLRYCATPEVRSPDRVYHCIVRANRPYTLLPIPMGHIRTRVSTTGPLCVRRWNQALPTSTSNENSEPSSSCGTTNVRCKTRPALPASSASSSSRD